jgi:hypothetical protein
MDSQKKKKILDLIKAICSRVQEREGYLNKTKLIKYLYLIDVEYYRRHGAVFTGLNWIFYDYGPWAYEYNDIFNEIDVSSEFTINTGTRPDLDTQFISVSDGMELSFIFKDLGDLLAARELIDRWADESLSKMLDYVYFHTEPMDGVERHQKLDFSKVQKLALIPNFELTKGNLTKSEKEKIRKKIQERISQKRVAQVSNEYTPPKYDQVSKVAY